MPIEEKTTAHSPVYFTRDKTFVPTTRVNKKALRAEELATQKVTVAGVVYDAGEDSMNRINRVLTLANARCQKAKSDGATDMQAYTRVFVNTRTPWKLADNTFAETNIKTLADVQEAAMAGMKAIWLKYG